jgi:hypothetical protein
MIIRFYRDQATGEPHIYNHGVTEEEVEEVLRRPGEDRRGREGSRVAIGQTQPGRSLRVIYVPDPSQTVYLSSPHTSCGGSRWQPIDGGSVGEDSDETGQISTRLG